MICVLKGEVLVLPCLTCGGAANRILDAVMWFSSGGTKSVLHFDGVENINCVLDGWKEVFLVDKVGIRWKYCFRVVCSLLFLGGSLSEC